MKKTVFTFAIALFVSVSVNAQLKKDGTPDMRYKANKEVYGTSSYTPSYSTPSTTRSTEYSAPRTTDRNYDNGGQIKLQDGYIKSNGTYVAPHLKTTPDNNRYNNLNQR